MLEAPHIKQASGDVDVYLRHRPWQTCSFPAEFPPALQMSARLADQPLS